MSAEAQPFGREAAAGGDPFASASTTRLLAMRWFSTSRVVAAFVLVVFVPVADLRRSLDPGVDARAFQWTAGLYLAVSVVYLLTLTRPWVRRRLDALIVAQVLTDLTALTLLIHAAGGMRTGLGALMIASVAGAAVVAAPLIATFLAAVAALLLLLETTYRILVTGFADAGPLLEAGLLGTAAFVTAALINWLAQRLLAQEALARARGADVERQLAITRRVIAELEQGVVVVGRDGGVRAANPTAWQLLGLRRADATIDGAPALGGQANDPTRGEAAKGEVATEVSDGDARGESPDRLSWRPLTDALARWRAGMPAVGEGSRGGSSSGSSSGGSSGSSDAGPGGAVFELALDGGASVQRLQVRVLPLDGAASGDTVLLLDDPRLVEERAQQLKLASMGRLSASIAHEIRNPLAAIRHANGLLAERQSDAMGARLAGIVESNSVRIDRIVEDVLSLSRRAAVAAVAIDLASFLPELVDELSGRAPEASAAPGDDAPAGTRIVVALRDDAPMRFDPEHLRQVLVNLIGNAQRYASRGVGAIRIEWGRGASDRLELKIVDDGPGLSPDSLQHVFEPFFTTEARGTGLGLYLAREICHANGAGIRYEPPQGGRPGAFVIEPSQ